MSDEQRYLAQESQASTLSEDLASEEEDEEGDVDYPGYYDDDDDAMGVGTVEASDATFQLDPEFYLFHCLSTEETWNYLDSQVRDVSQKLKVDSRSSRGMLQCLHWDSKTVVQRYDEDRVTLLVDSQLWQNTPKAELRTHEVCPVCLVPTAECKLFDLVCGHTFCTQCWMDYLTDRIKLGISASIECMRCCVRVSLEDIQALLRCSPELYAKFLRFSLLDFVQSHTLLRWCPGPDCETVFQVKERLDKQVVCTKCSTSCCFMCGESYHCPTDCETFRKWITKCQDDSETAHYIQANTKDCPSCHSAIEKNGGCNHMRCSNCNSDFCWMCLGEWKSHTGYYNCSKFEEAKEGTKVVETTQARKALEKYLFYYQRWANHNQSLQLEEETRRKILQRIEVKVAASSGTWIDWQYLLKAVELLRKCRYTLKYTYPYAYFMDPDRKPLFEYQQAQLEVEIENLSWKVERAETSDIADLHQQMNTAEVKRLTLLRDFVHE